ncbi:MAG: hypothetical protein IPK32_16845 [Verrucomicrobiaceae bacterium]|nr:hypothetical protein [Verrucomicrobiaceae bacterium]
MKPNTHCVEFSSIHADGSKKSLHPADVRRPFHTLAQGWAALVMLLAAVAPP